MSVPLKSRLGHVKKRLNHSVDHRVLQAWMVHKIKRNRVAGTTK